MFKKKCQSTFFQGDEHTYDRWKDIELVESSTYSSGGYITNKIEKSVLIQERRCVYCNKAQRVHI